MPNDSIILEETARIERAARFWVHRFQGEVARQLPSSPNIWRRVGESNAHGISACLISKQVDFPVYQTLLVPGPRSARGCAVYGTAVFLIRPAWHVVELFVV